MEKLPEIYRMRAKLLRTSLVLGIPAATFDQLVAPMRGKSEEEKEAIAAEILSKIMSEKAEDSHG